jgi:ribosomal protein S18 acetylase RimI-like enzyme
MGWKQMEAEFRKAVLPEDLRRLRAFDRKVFPPSDLFSSEEWREYEAHWMSIDGTTVGCCAFQAHVDFQEDVCEDGVNPRMKGSLYISTTGILPEYRGLGLGRLLKSWEVAYARYHGFHRIVTNTRKHNVGMITLNKEFGFRVIRTTRGYYSDPTDSTVVMDLRFGAKPRSRPGPRSR